MKLTYLDPVQSAPVSFEHPEALARAIADTLPAASQIQFLNQPFPLEAGFLKTLQVHFEREQINQRHSFACQLAPAEVSLAACEQLERLNFKQIKLVVQAAAPELENLATCLEHTSQFDFHVMLELQTSPEPTSEVLSSLYFLLSEQMGRYELVYTPGSFAQARTDYRFRMLAHFSPHVHAAQRQEAQVHKQFYLGLYEFLRLRLSSRVKTVLEINPFAHQHYYREFNRVSFDWDITLSGTPQHQLDQAQLDALGKTFDAVVLFQAFPSLRDPEAAFEVLKAHSRTTTEWIVIQYNFATLPTLVQLAQNQFQNATRHAAWWAFPKPQGLSALKKRFEAARIEMEWTPTRLPLGDFELLKNQLNPLLEAELDSGWKRFQAEADVLAWTGYGSRQSHGFGLAETSFDESSDGFVSAGFI